MFGCSLNKTFFEFVYGLNIYLQTYKCLLTCLQLIVLNGWFLDIDYQPVGS